MATPRKDYLERAQRRQLMRQAEGYLDLIMVFDDCWPLDMELRVSMAEAAIDCLTQITNPRGHLGYVLFLKGQACRACERHQQAVDYLQQSVELEPGNLHSYLALAWCYKRLKRIDLAIESMQAAVELDGDSAIAHYNLACYWSLACHTNNALHHLTRALDLNPDYRDNIGCEPDFDNIRTNPEFQALNTAVV